MSNTAAAAGSVAPPRHELTPFEGQQVVSAAIEIPNAAGGLREAMQFEPVELHQRDDHGQTTKVYVVLECDVAKIRFDPVPKLDALSRVHVLHAVAATMVDVDLVGDVLQEQKERILKAKEEAAGVQRLFDTKDAEDDPTAGADDEADPDTTVYREDEDGFAEPVDDDEAEPTPIHKGRKRGAGKAG